MDEYNKEKIDKIKSGISLYELRIGNIVSANGEEERVFSIEPEDTNNPIWYWINHTQSWQVSPVEATQEWLEEMGFEGLDFELYANMYKHQVQNKYFWMMGEELC